MTSVTLSAARRLALVITLALAVDAVGSDERSQPVRRA
jgi:hypothetical protein